MNNVKKMHCKYGHNISIGGRTKDGHCAECYKNKLSGKPSIRSKVQFCPKGHDTFVTGRSNGYCNDCQKFKNVVYPQEHKDQIKQQRKNFYELHKKQILEERHQYYIDNKDKILQYKNNFNIEHPEIVKLRDLRKHSTRKLRVAKFGQEGIVEFYQNCPEGMEVDHIIPLQGKLVSGLHVIWNLQYLTPRENVRKYNLVNLNQVSDRHSVILEQAGLK